MHKPLSEPRKTFSTILATHKHTLHTQLQKGMPCNHGVPAVKWSSLSEMYGSAHESLGNLLYYCVCLFLKAILLGTCERSNLTPMCTGLTWVSKMKQKLCS